MAIISKTKNSLGQNDVFIFKTLSDFGLFSLSNHTLYYTVLSVPQLCSSVVPTKKNWSVVLSFNSEANIQRNKTIIQINMTIKSHLQTTNL